MNLHIREIQEVIECGQRKANWYLDRHYILLDIQQSSRSALHPKDAGGQNAGQAYVRRSPTFVLGRPPDVDRVSPPEDI